MANSIFVDPSANGTLPISGTVGALLYWATANTVGEIPDVATGQVLASGGVGTVPAYTASPSVSGVLVGAGSVGTPAVRFSGDPDNGLYYIGTNNWGLSAGGALALDVSTVRVNAALPIYGVDGTAAAPSYSFASYTGTGWYLSAANTLTASTGGTARLSLTTAALTPFSDAGIDIGGSTLRFDRAWAVKFTSKIATGNGGTPGNRTNANITVGNMGALNDVGQITFGYASDGTTTYQPISVYAKTTSATGSTLASFNIAVRSVTTDTAPTTVWGIDSWGSVGKAGQTYASLSAPTLGYGYAVVTDSNTAVWGATIAGGGANIVLAFYNGTNWTVAGK